MHDPVSGGLGGLGGRRYGARPPGFAGEPMSGHKRWAEVIAEQIAKDPGFRVSMERARAELDAKWMIECRYGNCVIFVSPDSSEGPDQDDGWGPIDCPCRAGEYE